MAEVVVVHGYAGSGKTTQCERLAVEGLRGKSVFHVSAGNRLRAIRSGIIPSHFSEFITSPDAPSPPPDTIINQIIFEALEEGADHDLILSDGYPRRKKTVTLFNESLKDHGHELIGTVFFRVPKALSVARILERGEREGEKITGNSLKQDAERRYNRDAQRVHLAVRALGSLALVEEIVANRDMDTVFSEFSSAIGRMALIDATTQV